MTYRGEQGREGQTDQELQMEDAFVIYASAVINSPDIFFNLGLRQIIVPTVVSKELDRVKRSRNPKKATAAKRTSRTLDDSDYQNIALVSITSAGSIVRIFNHYEPVYDLASL